MRIAIGADHGGYRLKEFLKSALIGLGYAVEDMGTHSEDPVDYPDIAEKVARSVAEGKSERGILICGTGIGMCIAANKFPNVRAALCYDIYTARMSRLHNDSNVLALGGRITGEILALEIVKIWLKENFEGGRHERRIKKIREIEKKIIRREK